MKIQRGWLLSKDPDTNKNIPFFVKVRNKDIVVTDAPAFEDVFTKIFSNASYKLISQTPEASTYEVSHPNVKFKYYYKIYNDGKYEITAFTNTYNYGLFSKTDRPDSDVNVKIVLPYSFQSSNKGYGKYTDLQNVPNITVKPCFHAFSSSIDKDNPKIVFMNNLIEYSVLSDYGYTSDIESYTDTIDYNPYGVCNDIVGYSTKVYHTIRVNFMSDTLTCKPYYPVELITEDKSITSLMNSDDIWYYIEIKGRYK